VTQIEKLAAQAAMKKLLGDSHFSISGVQSIAKVLGLPRPSGRAYDTLHALHCVDYADMDPQLRAAIPGLIKECLGQLSLEHMP